MGISLVLIHSYPLSCAIQEIQVEVQPTEVSDNMTTWWSPLSSGGPDVCTSLSQLNREVDLGIVEVERTCAPSLFCLSLW